MDKSITILLADGNEDFAQQLKAAISGTEGYEVAGIASDGQQAVQMLAEQKPDVLILDLMLPKMDGMSVLKSVKAMEHQPVTMVVSAMLSDYAAAQSMAFGVQYLMPKPCDVGAVVERLQEIRDAGARPVSPSAAARRQEVNMEAMVTNVIHEIGVPAHITRPLSAWTWGSPSRRSSSAQGPSSPKRVGTAKRRVSMALSPFYSSMGG